MQRTCFCEDMDSKTVHTFTVDDVGFFEGAEKLLELWFYFPDISVKGERRGLRAIPRSSLEKILLLVKCKILSSCSNDCMDAYLLSESSMFVSWNRFILKTCGTTTLLHSIQPIIKMVQDIYPDSFVTDLFYSHRNFQQPQLQNHPHTSFEEEVRHLDSIFKGGAAYALGRLNGDTWYLYTMESPEHPLEVGDQTLEMLMTDISPELTSLFSIKSFSSADELTKEIGLVDVVPGCILDAELFDPCGYSLNAIVQGDTYYTIHVTPQEGCSYVSFETNLAMQCYDQLIQKVIAIFRPGKFTLTIFANKKSCCENLFTAFDSQSLAGYQCKDRQFSYFVDYNLTFSHYVRHS